MGSGLSQRASYQERGVTALTDGGAVNIRTQGMRQLTIITGTGATATYSRVDSMEATGHVSGTENGATVAATTKLVIAVDWPFYRVSVASGPCRIGVV